MHALRRGESGKFTYGGASIRDSGVATGPLNRLVTDLQLRARELPESLGRVDRSIRNRVLRDGLVDVPERVEALRIALVEFRSEQRRREQVLADEGHDGSGLRRRRDGVDAVCSPHLSLALRQG